MKTATGPPARLLSLSENCRPRTLTPEYISSKESEGRGPNAEAIRGFMNSTEIFRVMAEALALGR